MDLIASVLLNLAAVAVFTYAALAPWMTRRSLWGFLMLGFSMNALACALADNQMILVINTTLGTLAAWMWWNNGGGDNTKRRLRGALKKFVPVRRTAPEAA